jgi:hypothetical protein
LGAHASSIGADWQVQATPTRVFTALLQDIYLIEGIFVAA